MGPQAYTKQVHEPLILVLRTIDRLTLRGMPLESQVVYPQEPQECAWSSKMGE